MSRKTKDVDDLGDLLAAATVNRGGVVAVPRQDGALPEESRSQRLAVLESTIEASATTFRRAQARHYREVGPALEEIRDQRLYEESGYVSWLDYLARRWEYSESHAYRFIDMGRVCQALAPLGQEALEALGAESQARELMPVLREHGDDAAREVWARATSEPGERITAKQVAKARESLGYGVQQRRPSRGGEDASAHLNEELRAVADDLDRLVRRLDRAVSSDVRPADHGQALHDANRIRRAGRKFAKAPSTFPSEVIDAEVIEGPVVP
ncbi:hypothetical protein ABT282_31020 [Streptomyces sp. NPDC000927]|uniref:hypothetical protein n=1 Tax=Streptomyces sp. NPDC000927 TaxID=3154371 RepID=UPI00332179C3